MPRSVCLLMFLSLLAMKPGEAVSADEPTTMPAVVQRIQIDKVWSGHPVGFAALTHGQHQFVAYYDADRRMTVAMRKLDDDKWQYNRLDSRVEWDSHNYITMTLDRDNCLHVSGNMHCNPLVYFRADKPLDIASLKPVHRMVGRDETGVTYPMFIRNNEGDLLFMYRRGSSGNGLNLVNIYDEKTRTWKRLLDKPLWDGTRHSMNAYPPGPPLKGPDGFFHAVWMWRDTPDCRTCHDISYARSRDLVNWETAAGKPVELPITPDNRDVIVDPIPTSTGLVNIAYGVGIDQRHRPIVHYHYYDKNGNSQIYASRFEGGKWVRHQLSDWKDYRWGFAGGGAIEAEITTGWIRQFGKDHMLLSWNHKKFGHGNWKIDTETMRVVGEVKLPDWMPAEARKVRSEFKRLPMQVHWQGAGGDKDGRYFLRWETLGINRDQPRTGTLPEPSTLELFTVRLQQPKFEPEDR